MGGGLSTRMYTSLDGGQANRYRVQPAILTLLELHRTCPEIFGRMEIYIDGGVRRGTDILKALALGATAVGIGRPYLYSLTYGQEGVEHLTQSTYPLSQTYVY